VGDRVLGLGGGGKAEAGGGGSGGLGDVGVAGDEFEEVESDVFRAAGGVERTLIHEEEDIGVTGSRKQEVGNRVGEPGHARGCGWGSTVGERVGGKVFGKRRLGE